MVKISIIMPAYNVENYIEKAIDSIVNNGFDRYELIIVDDLSTDKTLNIAEEKAKQNEKIRVIKTKGGNGCSYGRKIGLDKAKGKYVYFCDADDYIEPGLLTFIYNEAELNQLDVLMFNGKFRNELKNEWGINHNNLPIVSKCIHTEVMSGEKLLEEMKKNYEWKYAVWLYLVKKQILDDNVDFFKGIVHEDPPYNYQLLNASQRVKFYDIHGYNYRLRSNSLMSRKTSIKDIEGYINAFNVIYNYNNKMYLNDESKYFFETRMLEQLDEAFSNLIIEEELKESSKMIKELFIKTDLRGYCSSKIVEKLKKEANKYE